MPTFQEIKTALTDAGFDVGVRKHNDGFVEVHATQETDTGLWLLFTNLTDENTPINLFEIGRGSDPGSVADFILSLTKTHGNFIYYSDSGAMFLVTANTGKETLLNEIYSG